MSLKLTINERCTLADIAWFLKGFVAAQDEDNSNEFGKVHYDVIAKIIRDADRVEDDEPPQAVCQFAKDYDSRIFDRIYRVFGSEDGGTILSAYWKDELKSFKVDVPYLIIKELMQGNQIGALCGNYHWREVKL